MLDSPAGDGPASSAATAFLQQLRNHALIAEAQALAHGARHLSITHGQPETDDEMARIQSVITRAWALRGDSRTTSVRGVSDAVAVPCIRRATARTARLP